MRKTRIHNGILEFGWESGNGGWHVVVSIDLSQSDDPFGHSKFNSLRLQWEHEGIDEHDLAQALVNIFS